MHVLRQLDSLRVVGNVVVIAPDLRLDLQIGVIDRLALDDRLSPRGPAVESEPLPPGMDR